MEKKHILIALAAIQLVVGSILIVRGVQARSISPNFKPNLEALIEGEIGTKGSGLCYNVVLTAPSASALHCGDCIYSAGIPLLDYGTDYCYE